MKEHDQFIKWFSTQYYPSAKTARAVFLDQGILPRLRNETICFFTPWGPRYSYKARGVVIHEEDLEVTTLRFLQEVVTTFEIHGINQARKFRWIILGADVYGTKINNLPKSVVADYFQSLKIWIETLLPKAEFLLWSDFDSEAQVYRDEVRQNFTTYIDARLLARAQRTSEGLGTGGSPEAYLIERLAEAMLIEAKFQPIKLSCVARYKDDKVDLNLPRLYVVPEHLHAPWL